MPIETPRKRDYPKKIEINDTKKNILTRWGDRLEIHDWAPNNMNWADVREHAIDIGAEELDDRGYQEGWINGEKKIIDLDNGHNKIYK